MLPKTLILAAGHGAGDCGAVSPDGRHNERDQAMLIVDAVAMMLTREGIRTVIAPHEHDTHQTIAWLNEHYQAGEAWALEIHRDSADTIKGEAASTRCGVYHGSSALSRDLAVMLVAELKVRGAHSTSWTRNQKESRHGRLGWIAQPKCLSHLVELGFMQGSNSEDHLKMMAAKLAMALAAVFKQRPQEA